MPATESSSSSPSFGLSLRRHQVHSMDTSSSGNELALEIDAFQRRVANRFADLSSVESDELLSLSWIRKLLTHFLACQEDFRLLLFNHKSLVSKSPLLDDFFERSVKALDFCNAIRDGIEQIREWKKLIEIILYALLGNGDNCNNNKRRMLSEGQFRRARKALVDLSFSMLDERDSTAAALTAHRNRSFGRQHPSSKDHYNHHSSVGHFRSFSWSVSRSWSAAKQLQAIGNNLVAPKGNEIMTNGIAVAVYTMSSVLLFVMWVLVAAIPCQDRGLQLHFSVPKHFIWAGAVQSLHDRIYDESRKKERRNACGLLREIYQMDRCAKILAELADSVQFPLSEEKEAEVRLKVGEMGHVCEVMREGLDPLERQVRHVFHRIVHNRTQGLDSFG